MNTPNRDSLGNSPHRPHSFKSIEPKLLSSNKRFPFHHAEAQILAQSHGHNTSDMHLASICHSLQRDLSHFHFSNSSTRVHAPSSEPLETWNRDVMKSAQLTATRSIAGKRDRWKWSQMNGRGGWMKRETLEWLSGSSQSQVDHWHPSAASMTDPGGPHKKQRRVAAAATMQLCISYWLALAKRVCRFARSQN